MRRRRWSRHWDSIRSRRGGGRMFVDLSANGPLEGREGLRQLGLDLRDLELDLKYFPQG